MISSGNSSTNMALDFIGKLFEKLRRPLGLFLLLVLTSILQHIFDMHFVCSCRPGGHVNDELYLILPSLIITIAVYIVKIIYKKKFFSTVDCCTRKRCPRACFFFGKRIFEYISLTALWTSMVLFDGDWYFCLRTNFNSTQTGLPCKKNLTYEEERIKDSYKTDSLDIGLGVCCGLLLLCSLVESFRTQCRSWCHQCRRPYYEAMYKKILSDELSLYIEEELKEIAKEKAKQICKQKIKDIRDHVLSQNNSSEDKVSQTWKDISDPSFIFEYQEMTERNTPNNTVTPDQSKKPEIAQEKQIQETVQDSCEKAEESANSSSASLIIQSGQPPTPSAKRSSETPEGCPDTVEGEPQPEVKSGESVVSGKGLSGDSQVEKEVSQVTEVEASVESTVSGGFTKVVDESEVGGEGSGVNASPAVCVDGGGGETSELVSKECRVDDSDACLEGED